LNWSQCFANASTCVGQNAMRVAVETRHQSSACWTAVYTLDDPRPATRQNDRRVMNCAYKSIGESCVECHTRRRVATKSTSLREQCSNSVVDVLSLSRLSHACHLAVILKPPPSVTRSALIAIVRFQSLQPVTTERFGSRSTYKPGRKPLMCVLRTTRRSEFGPFLRGLAII